MGEEKKARLIKMGDYYINPSRIDGITPHAEIDTAIYIGGSDCPYILRMSTQDVVQRLRELGVEIAS